MLKLNNLNIRVVFAITLLLILLVNCAVISFTTHYSKAYSEQINTSGQNRMLSQRIALFLNLLVQGDASAANQAEKSILMHENNLKRLEEDLVSREIDLSAPLWQDLGRVKYSWAPFSRAALRILEAPSADTAKEDLAYVNEHAGEMLKINHALVTTYVAEAKNIEDAIANFYLLYFAFLTAACIAFWYFFHTKIFGAINEMSVLIGKIANGAYQERLQLTGGAELSTLAQNMNKLLNKIEGAKTYISALGQGNYTYQHNFKEDDELFIALNETRNILHDEKKASQQREWGNKGMAIFADILRQQGVSLNELSKNIIKQLTDYVQYSQGAIFLKDKPTETLIMESCYAYQREKFLEKEILLGEGLISEVYLENKHLYLTELPEQYLMIKTGLGETQAQSVLMVPLANDQEVIGVLELAGLKKLEDFEIDFILKICETIGTTIHTNRMNEQNVKLLREAEAMAEQMRSTEEELRQNMEELQATQETIVRQHSKNNLNRQIK